MLNGKRRFILQFCILITSIFFILSIEIPGSVFIVSSAAADTIPAGDVSGTWHLANSPYYIDGDITIQPNDTLIIEPGVDVCFLSWSLFTVNGLLDATGTESDSISFTSDTSQVYWAGIRFDNAQDNSHLDYCSIFGIFGLHVYSPIHCIQNSNPAISNCRIPGYSFFVDYGSIRVESGSNPSISDCVLIGGNWAIYWNSNVSNAVISGCTISNCVKAGVTKLCGNLTMTDCTISNCNSQEVPGGGIRSESGNLILINCTISNDTTLAAGGGIYCIGGSHSINNCTFSGNTSWNNYAPIIGGGGICFDDASASLSYCTFYDNLGHEGGGAISINGTGNLTIDHCTIDSNCSWENQSSGIWLKGNPTTHITNTIISNNLGPASSCILNQGALTIEYTDLYNNYGDDIAGNVPAGFGELSGINCNGDSCDVYYNIFLDPVYVDPGNDYHLAETSPCIDAGDPSFPHDPDSTITDMGAYYFHYTGINEDQSSQIITEGIIRLSPSPCSGLLTISCNVSDNSVADIKIYDLQGRLLEKIGSVTGNDDIQFDTSALAAGIYFCRLESGNRYETGTFVVRR